MFISENTNVNDSAIFYGFLREALLEQVEGSEEMSKLVESMSDTDLLSYSVIGKATPADFDSGLYETALLSMIKEAVLEENEMFLEGYSPNRFIQEIGSLKFISSNDVLTEGFRDGFNGVEKYINKKLYGDKVGQKIAMPTTDNQNLAGEGHGEVYGRGGAGSGDGTGGFMDFVRRMGGKGANAWDSIKKFVVNHPGGIGAAAMVAAASFISYKVYQNYFSKAAKACAGKSGEAKTACMAKARGQANKARVASLNKAKGLAAKSKNPSKVRSAIAAKIAKLRG